MDATSAGSRIHALVGPTNTGKTYRAIERMLEHDTGMIGLPLRLLAREVYDKVSAKVGEDLVALVTGEEQRIPKRPVYWIATVEAMPVDVEVDFLAVDEVQLAAHDQRGHVFTSRILSARGRKETWFMGAGTMRRILPQLVPTVQMEEHPRLSSLTFAGSSTLAKLPRRSAVVAFSMPHVYEIAEKLRTKKGGAAVVLGGLSPRTRNAQVAMFQAGEVDYLVATDAVGMGLNLGVSHVAFASLRKFDGRESRQLDDAEMAQIAGRAGRWIENGTFGTLAPLDLPLDVARAVELHEFPFVQKVRWRNDRLDFGSIEALEASLAVPSPRPMLPLVYDAEDQRALSLLLRDDEVRRLARGEERVRLLWDVCTIPDFRKLLFEAHVAFLRELYLELATRGHLDDDWVAERVVDLAHDPGADVETLVARIAATRVWTYVANRSAWLVSPEHWQAATRTREDELSDALHARLVLRFVDASARARNRGQASRPRPSQPRLSKGSNLHLDHLPLATDSSHPFAKLAALRGTVPGSLVPVNPAEKLALRTADEQVELLVQAATADYRLEENGAIVHLPTSEPVAALVRGASIARPDVNVIEPFAAGARSRVHRRLLAFVRDVASSFVGGERARAFASREATPAMRGLSHRLEQTLGTAWARDLADVTSDLTTADRAALEEAEFTLGRLLVFARSGLTADALRARIAFARVWFPNGHWIHGPRNGAVSFVPPPNVRLDGGRDLAIGFPRVAGRAIRADVLERVDAKRREDPTDAIVGPVSRWTGCPERETPRLLGALERLEGSPSRPSIVP